jgi:hypothetical protein
MNLVFNSQQAEALRRKTIVDTRISQNISNISNHHQPIYVPTDGAQAFFMDYT